MKGGATLRRGRPAGHSGGYPKVETRRALLRTAAFILASILVVGCGSSATASRTDQATSEPTPTLSPAATPSPGSSVYPVDTPSATAGSPGPSGSAAATPTSGPTVRPTPTPSPSRTPPGTTTTAGRINAFARDQLAGRWVYNIPGTSPVSAALALVVLRRGVSTAAGQAFDQPLRSFGSDSQGRDVAALLAELRSRAHAAATSSGSFAFSLDHAAFVQSGVSVDPAYTAALQAAFGIGATPVDFAQTPQPDIRAWLTAHSSGLVDQLPGQTDIWTSSRVVTASSLYLKAGWSQPFAQSQTQLRPFAAWNAPVVDVPMMTIAAKLPYASGSGWQAVDLPLDSSGWLSMTVIVPVAFDDFDVSPERLAAIVSAETPRDLTLTLPRLHQPLQWQNLELGSIVDAVGSLPPGSLGILRSLPLLFDATTQLSTLDIDEAGVRASSATVVNVLVPEGSGPVGDGGTTSRLFDRRAAGSPVQGPPAPAAGTTLSADKPFIYFVRDTQSGLILLQGWVVDPAHGR
jgi:serine protease inhibitor